MKSALQKNYVRHRFQPDMGKTSHQWTKTPLAYQEVPWHNGKRRPRKQWGAETETDRFRGSTMYIPLPSSDTFFPFFWSRKDSDRWGTVVYTSDMRHLPIQKARNNNGNSVRSLWGIEQSARTSQISVVNSPWFFNCTPINFTSSKVSNILGHRKFHEVCCNILQRVEIFVNHIIFHRRKGLINCTWSCTTVSWISSTALFFTAMQHM